MLQKKLQDEFEADTLSLVANDKGGYFVNVKKKTELGRVERSGLFGSVSETRGSKTFVYSVSVCTGYPVSQSPDACSGMVVAGTRDG